MLEFAMPEVLVELNLLSSAVRLIMALFCGGMLGIERERKKRPAGLRTYMLVCVGATLVMMTNQYIVDTYQTGDMARLGAQVISGIGFLGAGTIIVTGRNRVKGLTTAAGLWASACIGLALGIGFYIGAVFSCLLIFFVLTFLRRLDDRVTVHNKIINLYIEFSQLSDLGKFLEHAKNNNIKVSEVEVGKSATMGDTNVAVLLTIQTGKKEAHEDILNSIRVLEGLVYVEEL